MKKSLAEYINSLKNQLYSIENWELAESVEQIADTYKAMLQFMAKGVEDPNAAQMQSQLWTKALSLQQRINRLRWLKDKPSSRYSTMCREVQGKDINATIDRLELTQDAGQIEADTVLLFKWALTSDQWKSSDYELCMRLLTSDEITDKPKAVCIAGVMLSNLEYYDERKLILLLDAYLLDNPMLSQRALVGIVLSLRKDAELIEHSSEILSRLDIFFGDDTFVRDTYNILIQLQISSQTDKVASKIRQDIMPTIVTGSATLKRQMGMLEINEKMTENGENPEWLQNSEENDSKAEEKIREMTDMHLNGEDVYMATFAFLKGYKFFNELAHWFTPFTIDDPALAGIEETMKEHSGRYMKALLNNSPFCDSDKFSLCMLTNSLGGNGFDTIASQMDAQMADLDEQEKAEILNEKSNRVLKERDYSRSFIFDLYRFYNISTFKTEFYDPFYKSQLFIFSPLDIYPLRPLTEHTPLLLEHAEFLMRKEYYKSALDEFHLYSRKCEHTAELMQKIGFCYQKLENWEEAKKYYILADSMKPDSKWTLSHLGKVSLMSDDYEKAMESYRQLCEIDSENVHYLLRYAEAQQKAGELDGAVSTLYKANYLSPDSERIKQLLGLCLMLCGEHEKGISMLDNPMDKAIAYMAMGKNAEAFSSLKTAYELTDDKKEFAAQYQKAALPYHEAKLLKEFQTELLYDSLSIDF